MIPFTSSMLLGSRPGRYRVHNFVIIEPPGLAFKQDGSANGINISLPGAAVMEEIIKPRDISEAEWILLETLDCRDNRPLHTGPFLTVQRRRRRRKYVRTFYFKDPTLIDDLSSHQTNLLLDKISQWEFNAFILDNVTGGRPLPNLCVHLFKTYGLLQHFKLDPVIVWKVFSIIEDGYHWRNPYHNAVHAADVTQAMHCFLQEKMILEKLTPIEIMSALLAAVTHDLDHPGVNQPFLVATSNHLAALYKNSSVLENHHWRSAMGCLNESGMSEVLGPNLVEDIEWRIRELILATDISRQKEFLDRLKGYLDTDTLDMNSSDVRHFILQIALKCADISNPCRAWEISRKWSMKVCEEFFRQGDYERQLNLPVTPLCDRYSTSVPKIQTGFFDFVVEPLFKLWYKMMETPLSTEMTENLKWNRKKWTQLLHDEEANDTNTEASEADETEIPQHSIEDSDSLNVNVARIAAKAARREARERSTSQGGRSVRFDIDIDTTVTAASDSEQSEGNDDEGVSKPDEGEFLGIPRPDRRRHSIATGLMGIQVPPSQLLSTMGGLSGSSLNISDVMSSSRTVGRTVIRRESLPSGNLLPGRALPSKTILHLQRVSAKAENEQTGSATSPTARAESTGSPELPVSPGRTHQGEHKSSCSSSSTVDEILDFTYNLPEPGSRSSGSPRRSTLEATDLDELCPPTSILSMSPSVAHVTLQQSIEIDEQRRHLIRQQTCPVVSVHGEGGSNFNRPRFLSAAAAISPTAVASSSIISQQRYKNRSPDSGGEDGAGQGRLSGGSSNEGLMQCCEVISEEGPERQSGGSSNEASPLEIFVQQFPPVSDDNDGEAPRRESGSCIFELDSEQGGNSNQSNNGECSESGVNAQTRSNCVSLREDCDHDDGVCEGESSSDRIQLRGKDMKESNIKYQDYSGLKSDEIGCPRKSSQSKQPECVLTPSSTNDSCTQTDPLSEKENFHPTESMLLQDGVFHNIPPSGISQTTSTSGGNNPLASLFMWCNNKAWKNLSEECPEETHEIEHDERGLPPFGRWDLCFSQQAHQGVLGARLQIRRGSAPTVIGQSSGHRGSQDRRSDPTQYHSHEMGYDASVQAQLRRGSVPFELLRQSVLRSATQAMTKGSNPRSGRRGSLPTEASSESPAFPLKWMKMLQYSEDDSVISMKRRSSGGPELFAAAQSKNAWKTPLLIERYESCSKAVDYPSGFWQGRRRGSLPVEVRIASSVSCSSESESSGDSSDT